MRMHVAARVVPPGTSPAWLVQHTLPAPIAPACCAQAASRPVRASPGQSAEGKLQPKALQATCAAGPVPPDRLPAA